MVLLETGRFETHRELDLGPRPRPARRGAGIVMLVLTTSASMAWLLWRISELGRHPVEIAVFATEIVSVATGLVVGVGMILARRPRTVFADDQRESFRFAFAVCDTVGRTRATDLRAGFVDAFRRLRRRRPELSDVVVAAVLLDGPRRLVLVVSLTVALLIGIAPLPMPPIWASAAGLTALATMSCLHVLLGAGRIRPGDRIRWSSAAVGEFWPGADHDGVPPRRWVGTMGAVVVLNLAIALRGISDRWTHGLPPMTAEARQVSMLIAVAVVAGGIYTLRTTAVPSIENSHLVPRRTEERTARQSALGAAVAIGLVGLIAGILPGNAQAVADPQVEVERVSDDGVAGPEQVSGDG